MWGKEAIPRHTSKDDLVERTSKWPKELKHSTKPLDVSCHAWRTKLIDRRGEIQPGKTDWYSPNCSASVYNSKG